MKPKRAGKPAQVRELRSRPSRRYRRLRRWAVVFLSVAVLILVAGLTVIGRGGAH